MFHFSTRNALLPSAAMTILLGLSACGGGGGGSDAAPAESTTTTTASGAAAGAAAGTVTTTTTIPPPPASAALPTKALGLTDQRATPGTVRLVGFDIAKPNILTSDVVITAPAGAGAFAAGEWIFGMDYRPVDGLLWGLTNRGRLYTIDPSTGVATFKVALTADSAAPGFTGLDSSTSVSVDFNPVADRMRVVTFVGQNLSINVTSGATAVQTDVPVIASPPAPAAGYSWVAGVAYSNNFAGATSTTLYTINNQNDNLSTQTPPAGGTQTAVGTGLKVAIGDVQGFDIAGSTNQLALGALSLNGAAGPHSLYNINLTTGVAVLRPATTGTAEIGGAAGLPLVDIAIRP